MATTTEKLGLTKPNEADYFNINDFNDNMDKVDALTHCIKSGSTAASWYVVNSMTTPEGSSTWRWKKYDDGTFEAFTWSTRYVLRCNEKSGEDGTWISGFLKFDYPAIGITNIDYVGLNVQMSGRYNWAVNCSDFDTINHVVVRLCGMNNEGFSERIGKRVFIKIEGRWA